MSNTNIEQKKLVIKTLSYLKTFVEKMTEWGDKTVLAFAFDQAGPIDLDIFKKIKRLVVVTDHDSAPFIQKMVRDNNLTCKIEIKTDHVFKELFDIVLFYSSLHDADNPTEALDHANRHLKGDGSLIILDALLPGEVRDIYQALISGKKYLTYHELMNALRVGRFVIEKYQPIYFKRPVKRSLEHVTDERKKDSEKFLLNNEVIKKHMGLTNENGNWFYFFDLVALLAKKGQPLIVVQE